MDFADAPLPPEFDADRHLDAWFNQGNSIGRGPKAPKDIDPKDRVIHDANGAQSAIPYPVDSIRSVASKLGITLPEQSQPDPPGRRALNRPRPALPAGHNRPDLGAHEPVEAMSDGPEIDIDAAIADLMRQKQEREQQKKAEIEAKEKMAQSRLELKSGASGAEGALIGLLSVYMPEKEFDANPIVQRIVRDMF